MEDIAADREKLKQAIVEMASNKAQLLTKLEEMSNDRSCLTNNEKLAMKRHLNQTITDIGRRQQNDSIREVYEKKILKLKQGMHDYKVASDVLLPNCIPLKFFRLGAIKRLLELCKT
jgi:hypothetical protein